MLAARARLDPFAVTDIEDALYERRTLLRMLAMRRTMFVVPLDLAAVLDAACTRALVPAERRKLVAMLAAAGVDDDAEAWIDRLGAEALAALHAHGPLAANQLTKLVPELARQVRVAVGKRYEGTIGMSTRMLFLLSAQGLIARARPLGTWQSSQYRWATMADWVGELPAIEPRTARAELVRRWLRAFGPGTLDDVVWWTKWTRADARAALADVGAVAVTTDTGDEPSAPAWVLPDDLDDTPPALAAPEGVPPISLLPGLDPTVMGWRHRSWYLGPHRAPLFDVNGNAGPTVWVGGQAVGSVEPTSRRHGRHPPAGGPADARRPARRGRGARPHGVDGRGAGDPPVPDAPRPGARRALRPAVSRRRRRRRRPAPPRPPRRRRCGPRPALWPAVARRTNSRA